MNLPNYFIADLPSEASLSPAIVAAACETLRRNREKYLAPRKTGEMVQVLCEVAESWLQPRNKFRSLALEFGPESLGYSRPIMEAELDRFFRRFTPRNFQALLDQDLGQSGAQWHGPRLLVHIAAGNIPNPALMSLTLGLLTRSAQFMKCATGASLLPRLFAHSIYELDHKLGSCLELAEWPGGSTQLEDALFAEADCLSATGSDETLKAVRQRVPDKARFLGYGHRVSLGIVTREILREETVGEVVARVADDIVAWDQNGCLSPHAIYVEERGLVESDRFAQLLALELMKREESAPRGKIPLEESAGIASRRALYETLAAHRGDVKIWQSQDSTAWTVVFEHDVRFRLSPLNRFIFVKPVPDLAAVFRGVDELKGKVSTVGIAAPSGRFEALALELAHWGVTRICAAGQMQNPPLAWRHDGRPALGDLVAWTDIEIEPQADTDENQKL